MKKNIALYIMIVFMMVGCIAKVCYAQEPQTPEPTDFFTDGFKCEINSDGDKTYTIVSYDSTIYTNIIPDQIDGYTITRIADGAFKNKPQVTGKVQLPASLISIGNEAFYGCNNITSVTFDDKLESVGNKAFANCTSLESIEYANVRTLGNEVFYRCGALDKYQEMPSSLRNIGDNAFYMSSIEILRFKTVNAPTITSKTFEGNEDIEIRVPKNAVGYTVANHWPIDVVEYQLQGDINDDGLVDSADAAIALNIFKYNNATEEDLVRGDMDYNGMIDSADAAMILNVFKYSL